MLSAALAMNGGNGHKPGGKAATWLRPLLPESSNFTEKAACSRAPSARAADRAYGDARVPASGRGGTSNANGGCPQIKRDRRRSARQGASPLIHRAPPR